MAKQKKLAGPSVLTANEILTGAIVYWTGDDWTTDIAAALRVGPDARAPLEEAGRREEASEMYRRARDLQARSETRGS